jgi:hypothetical protein
VHKLSALAVTGHNNLGGWAACGGLVDQIVQGGGTRGVSAGEETKDTGRVVHTLDCQRLRAKTASYRVEEGWAF